MSPPRHKILFLDAYDSFSNNITSLLSTLLDVEVFILPIDTPLLDPKSPSFRHDFRDELSHYAAVVCGPGPGSPDKEGDVGLMRNLWELEDERGLIPALGVCLGFQSLVLSCGGKIRRLQRGLHGMVRDIDHLPGGERTGAGEQSIFNGVAGFRATLYHSLCADVGQDAAPSTSWDEEKWQSPAGLPDIVPLAWVEEDRHGDAERVLMAMKHTSKPVWGLQYHPESVCTEEEGNKVIRNWFREALRWNQQTGRIINSEGTILARNAVKPSLLQQISDVEDAADLSNGKWEFWKRMHSRTNFQSRTIDLPDDVVVPDMVEIMGMADLDHIVLDSANASVPQPKTAVDVRGRYSIIALDVAECIQLEHHTGDDFVRMSMPAFAGSPVNFSQKIPLRENETVWQLAAEFHEAKREFLGKDLPDVPFMGGFVGYITYEQGLGGIGIAVPTERGHKRPDVCLAWVTKSIVVDHVKGVLHIQNLNSSEADPTWIESAVERLQTSHVWQHGPCDAAVSKNGKTRNRRYSKSSEPIVQKPEQAKYEAKVRMCQEFIAAGESYELCLTDQTNVTRPRRASMLLQEPPSATDNPVTPNKRRRMSSDKGSTSWQIYRQLRVRNPAPFASYLKLGGATLISSSPERFLEYSRDGLCSMKPMKGTVKKSKACSTLAQAEAILHIPKEEAENLMIVDLVRHDLHGICGPGSVSVPDLLKVEEYQTVFTMITVVEGQLPQPKQDQEDRRYTGLDVLAASLPPGSMTGAPKKRSCEILQQIEKGKERSLYSGVVGYMCVSGRGDWSVTIRSVFRWDDECAPDPSGGEEPQEVWHIGAGGAVTILSTPEGEREEMFVKLARPLSVFMDSA